MRAGAHPGAVFDRLVARGQIQLHPAAAETFRSSDRVAVVAHTRQQTAALNAAIRADWWLTSAWMTPAVTTGGGERIGVGNRIATRRNDYRLSGANRDTWTVIGGDPSGRSPSPPEPASAHGCCLPTASRGM